MPGLNGNGRWWIALLVPTVLAVGGYGALRQKVASHDADLERKANRETVDAQTRAVLDQLSGIRSDIQELRRDIQARRP